MTRHSLFITAALTSLLLCACGGAKIETVTTVDRGPLRCTEMVERRQVPSFWWEVSVAGKPFLPEGKNSNIYGGCSYSTNPNSHALLLLFAKLGLLRSINGKADFKIIEPFDGMESIDQFKHAVWSCAGQCIAWNDRLLLLETGEFRTFPRLPGDLIALAPDLKSAVVEGINDLEHDRLSVKLFDLETAVVTERWLKRADNAWILDRTQGVEAVATKFKWEPGAERRLHLVYPAEDASAGGDRRLVPDESQIGSKRVRSLEVPRGPGRQKNGRDPFRHAHF